MYFGQTLAVGIMVWHVGLCIFLLGGWVGGFRGFGVWG